MYVLKSPWPKNSYLHHNPTLSPHVERNLAEPAPLVDLGRLGIWWVVEMGEPKLRDADKFVLQVVSGAGRNMAVLFMVVICPWWVMVGKKRQFCAGLETGS